MHRVISFLLVIILCFLLLPCSALAEEYLGYHFQNISFIVEKGEQVEKMSFPLLVKGDELYIEPNRLADITRYQFTSDEDHFIFTLGLKSLVIDISKQTFQVNFTEQFFSGNLYVNNTYYLPLSEILPWMNVQCSFKDNQLYVKSDMLSYWEVISDFESQDYLFDLAETYGDSFGNIAALCAIGVLDSIFDLVNVWKKVPIVDGISLYNYEIYKECFRSFALPDVGSEAEAQETLSGLSELISDSSDFLEASFSAIEEIDWDKIDQNLAFWLGDDSYISSKQSIDPDTESVLELLKFSKVALKYYKTGYLYARIVTTDTIDYADALRYIYFREGTSPKNDVQFAASESILALESSEAAVVDAAATILYDVSMKMLSKSFSSASEDVIKFTASNTIFGSLGLYIDLIDSTLSVFWPVNEAYSEISKMTVYQSLQYDAIGAYYSIPKYYEVVNEQDISIGRTSALIFLKAAKKCFEAQQEAFNLYGGDGVLDWKLERIKNKILEFEMSSLAEQRDAIVDRASEVESLKKCWKNWGILEAAGQIISAKGDEHALIEYCNCILSTDNISEYGFYDLDKDGISELIIRTGISEVEKHIYFYTYRPEGLVYLGTISGSHNFFCVNESGELILVFGHMGDETASSLTIQNNEVKSEIFYKNQIEADQEYRIWGKDLEMFSPTRMPELNDIFTEAFIQDRLVSDYFYDDGKGLFTNGATSVATLIDHSVIVINVETGKALSHFKTESEVSIVGVNNKCIFLLSYVPNQLIEGLDSKYVQAYSFSGEVQEYNFYPDKIIFQEGYLILLNYREYLWPAQTDIIDKDNVFVGNIGETWDACVLDGDVYYLLPNDFNGRGESLISIVRYNGEQFDILGSIPIDVGDREWWVSAKIDGYVIAVRYEAIRMGQRDEYYNLLDGSPRNSLD